MLPYSDQEASASPVALQQWPGPNGDHAAIQLAQTGAFAFGGQGQSPASRANKSPQPARPTQKATVTIYPGRTECRAQLLFCLSPCMRADLWTLHALGTATVLPFNVCTVRNLCLFANGVIGCKVSCTSMATHMLSDGDVMSPDKHSVC